MAEYVANPSSRRHAQYRMFGVSSTGDDGRVSSPIEVPDEILEWVSTLCLALPEVTVRVDASLTRARSTAHSFDIRRRFADPYAALCADVGPPTKADWDQYAPGEPQPDVCG